MRRIVPLLCFAALAACSDELSAPTSVAGPRFSVVGTEPSSYVIDFASASLPSTLTTDISGAGGKLTAAFDEIGVAVASSADPSFAQAARRIAGVRAVDLDIVIQQEQPTVADAEVTVDEADISEQAHGGGDLETFRLIQWAPDAVSAPAAWATGARGAGARVAVLDGGIHSTHIDIAPNLDVARSRSFVPGQAFNADMGTFWHGTHVAGIVAAPANHVGTVGIAPAATLIGVKVLHNGTGSFSNMIAAVLYASTPIAAGGAGANIINLSLGAGFGRRQSGAAALNSAIAKAMAYAEQRGVTVIAALGNAAIDFDHTADTVFMPAMSTHTIAVSALGPMGWALGSTDLDRPASYTNFGQSAVDLAGPGGDFALPGNAVCSKPRVGGGPNVVNFCWVFDMVMSTTRGPAASNSSYGWAAGTSMAGPAVAGVAALIVGQHPGISPAQLRAKLVQSADDLGKPGNDDFYGGGRVNALRAIQ